MKLVGYGRLTQNGFALPYFATSPTANQLHTAVCDPTGDRLGIITGFEEAWPSCVTALPAGEVRDISAGDLWTDVFCWDDSVIAGTVSEITEQMGSDLDDLLARAPLTGYDLVCDGRPADAARFATAATNYLFSEWGQDAADGWRRTTARHRLIIGALRAGLVIDPRSIGTQVRSAGRIRRGPKTLGADLFVDQPELKDWAARLEEELNVVFWRRPQKAGLGRTSEHQERADVAIVLAGTRAERIGRLIQLPAWTPDWNDGRQARRWLLEIDGQALLQEWPEKPPRRVVVMKEPVSGEYGCVIVLADEDLLASPAALNRLGIPKGRVRVAAPAILQSAPSTILSQPGGWQQLHGFDLVLDTTAARSPFWPVRSNLSLDRRIADLTILAALLCAEGDPVHQRVREGFKAPLLLSITPDPDRLTPLPTETNFAPLMESVIRETYWEASEEGIGTNGLVLAGGPVADFQAFGDEIASRLVEDSDGSRPAAVLRKVRDRLKWPGLVSGQASPAGPVMITAEPPGLPVLRAAVEADCGVVRYTDLTGLKTALRRRPGDPWAMPNEIETPDVAALSGSRRLATRGADPRDLVIVSAEHLAKLLEEDAGSDLARVFLPYLEKLPDDQIPRQFAAPRQKILEQADRHPQARRLLRNESKRLTAKRQDDLANILLPVGRNEVRYLVRDGRPDAPVIVQSRADVIPAQAFFVLHGDAQAQILLESTLFRVWLQIMRSPATGWTPRYSMTRTFETFPVTGPFRTIWADRTLLVSTPEHPLSERLESLTVWRGGLSLTQWAEGGGARDADDVIFEAYGLPPRSGPLAVAERLFDLNQLMSRA